MFFFFGLPASLTKLSRQSKCKMSQDSLILLTIITKEITGPASRESVHAEMIGGQFQRMIYCWLILVQGKSS